MSLLVSLLTRSDPLTVMQLGHGEASRVVHAVNARKKLVLVLLGAQVDHRAAPETGSQRGS